MSETKAEQFALKMAPNVKDLEKANSPLGKLLSR